MQYRYAKRVRGWVKVENTLYLLTIIGVVPVVGLEPTFCLGRKTIKNQ